MTLLPSPKFKKKTDNQSLPDKCALRRRLIEETQMEPLRVLDLFAGEGCLWTEMRKSVKVDVYTPVDYKPRQPGQITAKITPRLIASLNGDTEINSFTGTGLCRYNTIDIDPYGDPFEIWEAVLFRIKQPTLVNLTRGRVTYGAGRMPISKHMKKIMGIPADWDIPARIEVLDIGDRFQLLQPCPTAKIEKGYWIRGPRADYYSIFVIPKEQEQWKPKINSSSEEKTV